MTHQKTTSAPAHLAMVIIGDLLVIVSFVSIGRQSHALSTSDLLAGLMTAIPFVGGWFALWWGGQMLMISGLLSALKWLRRRTDAAKTPVIGNDSSAAEPLYRIDPAERPNRALRGMSCVSTPPRPHQSTPQSEPAAGAGVSHRS